MELARESRRGQCIGQILNYWYWIMCLDMEEPIKQCYEWQKSNTRVRSWTIELKEQLHTRLAFMCILRETKIVKNRSNDTER